MPKVSGIMAGSGNKSSEQSYRNILRSSTAFGGVQVLQILISLVRGKLVAIFLGPAGMGMVSLFTTATNTIQRIASLGLNLAIVKEVGAGKEDAERLRQVTAASRLLLYATALLGAVICLAGAPWLSRATFGSDEHTAGFMVLSLAVFFSIAGAGELSFLQGLRQARRMMWSSLVGASVGLCVSVPLYWLMGQRGIVPAMVVLTGAVFAFNFRAVRQAMGSDTVKFLWSSHKRMIKTLLATGIVLMASDAIGTGCQYALNAIIRICGSVTDVGLFQAANSLTMQYSGVVLAALAMDYLPRLAAVASSNRRLAVVVNRQAEIVALAAGPLGAILIVAAPLVVQLLLTQEFESIVPLLRWMGLALALKSLMFPLGYITFAKDNRRVFFWLEGVFGNLMLVALGCGGYMIFGVVGLAYAQAADCLLSLVIYYIINHRLYGFRFSRRTLRTGLAAISAAAAVLALSYVPSAVWSYTAMCIVTLAISVTSGRTLLRLWRYGR